MEFLVLAVYAWVLVKDPEPHQVQQTTKEQIEDKKVIKLIFG